MSEGRSASLDSSLLAHKGAATPAIPDESPLVLHLETQIPEPGGSEKGPGEDRQPSNSGFAAFLKKGLSEIARRLALVSPGIRLAAVAGAVALVVAVIWLASDTADNLPEKADVMPEVAPIAAAEPQSLQLNLTTVPAVPALQSDQAIVPNPPGANVVMPASAALAATGAAAEKPATVQPATDLDAAAPASGTVIPVNVPSSEVAPPDVDLNAVPEISTTIPKAVSPIPKAKPAQAVVPAGRYAVQLASITAKNRAQEEAFRLQKQLGSILGGREIKIERAVVAGKGTMYRLRASGFQSLAEARAACAQAVRLKSDCLAIRR